MRFMIIVKATKDSEAGVMPHEQILGEMAKYHEELQLAGVLLDASGLQASSKGWRVRYSGVKRTVLDGPFTEAKELIAGYTLIQVKSKEEAREWARRFPNPALDGKEREIDDLDAVIREAAGSAFVYAMSSGAALALEAGASRLDITKLALYEPPFMVGSPAHVPPVDHHARLVRLIAEGRRGDAVKFYLKDVMGMPGWLVTVFRFLPMWSKLKTVARSLPYDSAVMGDFSLPAKRAASLTIPTLVICCEKSIPLIREGALRLSEVVPRAQLRTLPGQTHNAAAGGVRPRLQRVLAPLNQCAHPR